MRQLNSKMSILLFALALAACDIGNKFDAPDKDYFVKYYGSTEGSQTGVDMVVEDGVITAVGTFEKSGQSSIYFLRTDLSGDVITEVYYEGTSDVVKDIEILPDRNFIILSQVQSVSKNIEFKLIKVAPDGTILNTVITGFVGNDYPKSVSVIDDKIYISGTTDFTSTYPEVNPPDPDLGDFIIRRFSMDLVEDNPVDGWAKRGYNSYDVVTKILKVNSQLVAFGYTTSQLIFNPNRRSIFVYYSLEESGSSIYPFSPSTTDGNVEVSHVGPTPSTNPGVLAVGNFVNSLGVRQFFVSKLKEKLGFKPESNDAQLYSTFNPAGANQFNGIYSTFASVSSEGFLVAGNDLQNSSTSANVRNNIWVCKLDYSGQVLWSNAFGSEKGNDLAGAIQELPDGKILVLGTTELGDTQRKLTLIKLNSRGELAK